jgi:hypothetical protein
MTSNQQIKQTPSKVRAKLANSASPSKRITKKEQLIKLLRSRSGAEITVISQKLDWQKHTTRAALTKLRQAGYQLVTLKGANNKPTRYRVTAIPQATEPVRAQVEINA